MFILKANEKIKCYFCDETEDLKAVKISKGKYVIGGLIACPEHIKQLSGAIINLDDIVTFKSN